jgi:hypothetical protein
VEARPEGGGLYRKRIQMIEPVFAHTKHNRLINRFHRKGRIKVRTEWRLLMATHNLTSSTATNSPPPAPEPAPPDRSHHQRPCAVSSGRTLRDSLATKHRRGPDRPRDDEVSSRCADTGHR